MSGRALLDTNFVIALIGGTPAFHDTVTQFDEVFIPTIVVGELYYGAFKSARSSENVVRIDELVRERSILVADEITGRYYGEIKNQLRIKGRPIPENDIWIAAMGIQHDATVLTSDRHFREVDGLRVQGAE